MSMPHMYGVARIALLVVLGLSTSGCELVGGIFEAGVWVGALGVIVIAVLVAMVAMQIKR